MARNIPVSLRAPESVLARRAGVKPWQAIKTRRASVAPLLAGRSSDLDGNKTTRPEYSFAGLRQSDMTNLNTMKQNCSKGAHNG